MLQNLYFSVLTLWFLQGGIPSQTLWHIHRICLKCVIDAGPTSCRWVWAPEQGSSDPHSRPACLSPLTAMGFLNTADNLEDISFLISLQEPRLPETPILDVFYTMVSTNHNI